MDVHCRRRTLLSGVAVGLTGCASANRGTDDRVRERERGAFETDHEIAIYDDRYHPAVLEIEAGDRVVWRNEGTGVYTVTAKQRTLPPTAEYFASGGAGSETVARLLYPFVGGIHGGETYAHAPTVPGEYEYYSISQQAQGHEMVGTLVVK